MFKKFVIFPVLSSIATFADRNAFCIAEEFYTYKTLGQTISKVRDAIASTKIVNKNVGLVINDDIETYASIFALWLEGYSYVPLHPNWPLERCMNIVDQVGMDIILDSSSETRYADVKVLHTSILNYTSDNLDFKEGISDENIAYILFTSGSTGKPKGVQLTRTNIGTFMDSFWKTGIALNENDRCLQAFDLTFDVSVQSYLAPLTKGACCYTIPYGQIKYVYASGLIEEQQLTFGAMAPSMLRYLKPYFEEFDATSMKQCILTAEACPLKLMEEWYQYATNVELYDFYGPTEATIYCTYYKLTRGGENKTLNGIISIGKPMANVIGLILDEQGNEVPDGEKGELCIAGDQVTCGYFNNPEKNTEAFFMKEFNGEQTRFYHTGDLCYKDVEGDIMYSGRLDHQAKIQGFRVEMGEIEFHAREYLGGTNVVCIAFDNADSLTEIAMFIEREQFDTDALTQYMRTKMPSYMIPTRIIFIPTFPLNSNDKIDKVKLKALIKQL
ncbi:AMP-binding protein [Bacteroides acidifaciens]|jgi:Non-ribosomal peptide synthetase modules and related proteins|uniref:AMP-binding protein n=1 Tax=Bacteroides acidifaciens TaxID=85831 RepID=UPI001F5AC6F0|nr:AMP-binding protein [Bacteroides acidifaciens]